MLGIYLRGLPIGNRQRSKINYREICGPVIAVIIASALDNASHGVAALLTRSLLFFFFPSFFFIPPSPRERAYFKLTLYQPQPVCHNHRDERQRTHLHRAKFPTGFAGTFSRFFTLEPL